MLCAILQHLRNLKREKYPRRSVTFSKVEGCEIYCHSYNFKKVKNTHGGVLLLVKLKAPDCNFTKSNTPPWVFFTFLNCVKGTKSTKAFQIILKTF